MMKNIASYYTPTTKRVHSLLTSLEDERDKEGLIEEAARSESKAIARKLVTAKVRQSHAECNEKRINFHRADPVDELIDEICCDERQSDNWLYKKRTLLGRPNNWEIIAKHYGEWGMKNTIRTYPIELGKRSERSADQALRQWLLDFRAKKPSSQLNHRAPAYGHEIDLLLLKEVKVRIEAGLPVDDVVLRLLLVDILEAHRKGDILVENEGKFSFGHGWAYRFWKRHSLVSRVVTTKMRILPSNFDSLEENYIAVAAQMVHRYKIP